LNMDFRKPAKTGVYFLLTIFFLSVLSSCSVFRRKCDCPPKFGKLTVSEYKNQG
jgi:hypothetical protein